MRSFYGLGLFLVIFMQPADCAAGSIGDLGIGALSVQSDLAKHPDPEVRAADAAAANAEREKQAAVEAAKAVDAQGKLNPSAMDRAVAISPMNLSALIEALQKAKPATSKGVYLRKIALSSTMGVGVRVDQATLAAQ